MVDRSIKKAVLRVRRGAANEEGRYDDFEVPYEDGMSVLDALRWIRVNLDSTLGDPLQLHQCQRVQNLYGPGQRRGGIHLHCEADPRNHHCRTAAQAAADS